MTNPTKIHLTFRTDASGSVLIDKASPEPFVGSEEFVRAQGWQGIESAPKEKPFLAIVDGEEIPLTLRWYDYDQDTREELGEDGYFHYADEALCDIDPDALQRFSEGFIWHPLPPSPSEKGVG